MATYYKEHKETTIACIKSKLNTESFEEFYHNIGCPSEDILMPVKSGRSRCFYCTDCKKYAYKKIKVSKDHVKIGKKKFSIKDIEECENE